MQQQALRPTVGDTTTLVYRLAVPPDAMVLPRAPTDTSLVTMLAPPTVQREGDTVRIAWPVTLWAPGQHTLTIPGVIVVRAGVPPDTLGDLRVPLHVASVLPERIASESLPPQPPRGWVQDGEPTLLPLLLLLPPLLLLLGASHWWWRRRGPVPSAPPAPIRPPLDAARVERWLAAGEGRLVLRHLAAELPDTSAANAWRARADAIRYAPVDATAVLTLAREGWALHQRGGA